MRPLHDRILVQRLDDPDRIGLIYLPEIKEKAPAAKGKVLAVGNKVHGVKQGDVIAFTGRWDDAEGALLPDNQQLIRVGDVMGTFG
jgi:co-chaperonin GroES (HSP10)